MTTRREILAGLPIVFGLSEAEAAAAIGISATKFRELRKARRMPIRARSTAVWFMTLTNCARRSRLCPMMVTKPAGSTHGPTFN
jgi:hypothetical protein